MSWIVDVVLAAAALALLLGWAWYAQDHDWAAIAYFSLGGILVLAGLATVIHAWVGP